MVKNIPKEKADLLKEHFPSDRYRTVDDVAEAIGMKKNTVAVYARMLGLKRPKIKRGLSEKEEQILREHYPKSDMSVLCKLLNKNSHAICELAYTRGLKREIVGQRKGDLEPFFDNSLQSFYFHGLMWADGYVHQNGHLMFSQGDKDLDLVNSFAEFTKSEVYRFEVRSGYSIKPRNVNRVSIQDSVLGKKLRSMWGMKDGQKKTYSEIDTSFIQNRDQFLAFIIGLFDGDGHRYKKSLVGKIEAHASMLPLLKEIHMILDCAQPKISERGYAILLIKKSAMKKLEEFILKNSLQVSPRKWFT